MLHDDEARHTAVKLVSSTRSVASCSAGQVYYDLLDAREEKGVDDVYIMRLEQFYPWPVKSLSTELSRFPNAALVWCQEEPKNMGGWTFLDPWLELTLERLKIKAKRPRYVGRPASASTGPGQMSRHMKALQTFLAEAPRLRDHKNKRTRDRTSNGRHHDPWRDSSPRRRGALDKAGDAVRKDEIWSNLKPTR